MARGDPAVDTLLIIRAIAGERGDRAVDLVEQGTDLRAIIGIPVGQHRRDDLPGAGIHTDVQLSPGPAGAGAVLLDQPFAGPTQAQAGAVHQQVHGFAVAARRGRGTSSVSARRHRVVWSGTARSSPSRPMTEPMRPSVWRNGRRKTALKVNAVRIARGE